MLPDEDYTNNLWFFILNVHFIIFLREIIISYNLDCSFALTTYAISGLTKTAPHCRNTQSAFVSVKDCVGGYLPQTDRIMWSKISKLCPKIRWLAIRTQNLAVGTEISFSSWIVTNVTLDVIILIHYAKPQRVTCIAYLPENFGV